MATRRTFMKSAGLLAATATGYASVSRKVQAAVPTTKTFQRLSVRQLNAWQDLQYGMFLCFGIKTFAQDKSGDGNAPLEAYNPRRLDVGQWIRVAKEAGMKYAILTAKQVPGFSLWPSAYSDYSVKNCAIDTDIVGEFVSECRKQGILPGLYYCSWDNHHRFGSKTPNKSKNYLDSIETPTEKEPLEDAPFTTHLFQNFMTAQIDELLGNYGPLVEFWIDIPAVLGNGYRRFLYDHLAERDPNMVIVMNHGLKKVDSKIAFNPDKAWPTDVLTMEQYYPNAAYDPVWHINGKDRHFPAETCFTMGKHWYWEDEDHARPIEKLTSAYQSCLDHRVNLLLSVPPNREGIIPDRWIDPLMEMKKRVRG